MKRYLWVMVVVVMALVCMTVTSDFSYADQTTTCRGSGSQSSSGAILARAGRICDLAAYTDGTNAVTVICYDNATAASGKEIARAVVSGTVKAGGDFIPVPTQVVNGIYCSLSGTGGTFRVTFDVQ